jgi:hypothetical protein
METIATVITSTEKPRIWKDIDKNKTSIPQTNRSPFIGENEKTT